MQQPSVDVHIGQRLRLFRERHGLSQAAFAGFCGLSIAEVDDRETGVARIDLASLLRAASLLEVQVHSVFDDEGEWSGEPARSARDRPLLVDRDILLLVDRLKNADLRRQICEALVTFAVSDRIQLVLAPVAAPPALS